MNQGIPNFPWLAGALVPTNSPLPNQTGRAGGLFDRTNAEDRNEWNSDDEAIDEFGRRKKRRTAGSASKKVTPDCRGEENGTRAIASTAPPAPSLSTAGTWATASTAPPSPNHVAQGVLATQARLVRASMPFPRGPGVPAWPQPVAVTPTAPMQRLQIPGTVPRPVSPMPKTVSWRQPVAAESVWHSKQNSWDNLSGPKDEVTVPDVNASKAGKIVRPWNGVPIVPCKFFQEGQCSRGGTCTFLHTGQGGVVECKFFMQGRCMKGASCPFRHLRGSDLREVEDLETSFVDFETGLPKSSISAKMTSVAVKSGSMSEKSSGEADTDDGQATVNIEEALEDFLKMV